MRATLLLILGLSTAMANEPGRALAMDDLAPASSPGVVYLDGADADAEQAAVTEPASSPGDLEEPSPGSRPGLAILRITCRTGPHCSQPRSDRDRPAARYAQAVAELGYENEQPPEAATHHLADVGQTESANTEAVATDAEQAHTGEPKVGSAADCGEPSCDNGDGGSCKRRRSCCRSTCDMPPHYPYLPELHGYYYFRPYNHTHVLQHQQQVLRWGGDPHNPYVDGIFKKVYEKAQ